MSYSNEQLSERFNKIPPELQEALESTETAKAIQAVGQKHNLHIDQIGKVSEELGLVMLGLTRPKDFSRNIQNKAGLAEDVANLITYDLNQSVLSKIRQSLEALNSPAKETAPAESKEPTEKIESVAKTNAFTEKFSSIYDSPKKEVEVKPQNSDNDSAVSAKPVIDPYREKI